MSSMKAIGQSGPNLESDQGPAAKAQKKISEHEDLAAK